MPVEQMRPVMKMRRLDWSPGRLDPTALAMGTRRTEAMVWEMKVEMTCVQRLVRVSG